MSESNRNLEMIKDQLLKRKYELDEQFARSSSEKVTDNQVQDPGDQALSSTMETLRGSLQDAEIEEYKRIVRALEKIKDGTYGICVDCSQPILEKRLKSYPNAARCLACQEAFEDRSDLE